MKTKLLLLSLAVLLLVPLTSSATHINGAYFSYKVDPQNPLKYKFKFTLFSDDHSMAEDPMVQIGMGDLTQVSVPRTKSIPYLNHNSIDIYEWEYTYAAPGNYMLYWIGIYRNPNIINAASPSDQMTQFISAQVKVGQTGLHNNGVEIIVPAPLEAFAGEPFKLNTIAYDVDGDRITYELVPPKYIDNNFIPQNLPGYKFPDGLYINTFGELHWQTPSKIGPNDYDEYAIAVKITEYKGDQPVGYTIVDLSIRVRERENHPIVELLNRDRLIVNYDGSVYAMPEQTLKLEFFVEKAPNSMFPVYAKQFSDLDTLDLAAPELTARDSANGLAVTLKLTPELNLARKEAYVIGLRGAAALDSSPNSPASFQYGWDFVNIYIGAQQPTSSGDLADEINVYVYPNPVTDNIFIEGITQKDSSLQIWNVMGQQVAAATLRQGKNMIKRPSGLPSGVYLYHVISNGNPIKAGKLIFD